MNPYVAVTLLVTMAIVALLAFIRYEVTWWHYERQIRACDEKLKGNRQ